MRSMPLLFLYKLPRKPDEVKFLWSREYSVKGERKKAKGKSRKSGDGRWMIEMERSVPGI